MPEKEKFHGNLNLESIKRSNYNHADTICENFEKKIECEYHDFYFKSNRLLLDNVSKNFRKICWEIFQLDSQNVLLAPGLDWQAALKSPK